MGDEIERKFQKELNAGTTALILLSIMEQADTPMYGYQITKLMEERTGELEIMKQGALYPVLRSLENNGLLSSQVDPSVSGPPRRYYSITEAGIEHLPRWREIWRQTRDLIDNILRGEENV